MIGRSKNIVFTKEAVSKQKEIAQYFKKINRSLIKNIPKEKLDTFLEVLEMMKKNIENE